MYKFVALLFFVLFTFVAKGQEVSYDTTYQVTYDNGIKDSVIIITKKVLVKEMVYIVDSTVHKNWAADFYFVPINKGIANPNRTFNFPEQEVSNSIKSLTGQSLGASIYYKKNNWEWRGGIQVSRYKSKINCQKKIQNKEAHTYVVNDTLDSYYSVNGPDTTYYYVIDPLQKTDTLNVTNYQNNVATFTSNYFELILQGGYRKEWNKYNLYVFAGPVLGFLIYSKGYTINSAGEKVNIHNENHSACIVSAQVNIQLAYDINLKSQVFVEPYFQKFILTPTSNNSWMKKSDLVGIRFGLKLFL